MEHKHCKLLVIGFDGLDFELFQARHKLPVRVLPLYSPVPVTGPAWTSLYTGDSVSTHKVRDCFGLPALRRYARSEVLHQVLWRSRRLAGKLGLREPLQECRTYADTSSAYVWDTLGEHGVTVKLVNLPVASPVRAVNGVHVGGWPLDKRRRWYWPDDIVDLVPPDYAQCSDIMQWFEEPVVDRARVHRGPLRQMGEAAAREKTRATSQRLADLFVRLPRAQFQMVQFSFIDRLGHVFGIEGEMETFCYGLVRELSEMLLEAVKPESFALVGDHGFRGPEHTDYACLAVGGPLQEELNLPSGYRPDTLDLAPTIAGVFGVDHSCEGNDLRDRSQMQQSRKADDAGERETIIARMREIGYM